MLEYLSASGLNGVKDMSLGFDPRVTAVLGPVGAGKTMLLRDVLFLLLTGKIPGKRTLDSLGRKMRALCALVKPGQSLCLSRVNGKTTVLEDGGISGVAAVAQRISEFTGVPTSSMYDLCYCNGITLPSTLLTSGALLSLVRSALGSGVQTAGKLVGAELSSAKGAVDALQRISGQPVDIQKLEAEYNQLQERIAQREAQLRESAVYAEVAMHVVQCPTDEELAEQIQQATQFLGGYAAMPEDVFQRSVFQLPVRQFAADCLAQATSNAGDISLIRRWMPMLGETADLPVSDVTPAQLCAARARLQTLLDTESTPAANKEAAERYLEWHDGLRFESSRCQGELATVRSQLEIAQHAAAERNQIEADIQHLRQYAGLLETLLDYFQPSGKYSIEKQVIENLFSGLLRTATDLLETSGIVGELKYSAEDGLYLARRENIPVDELSGGELTLAALTVRLAVTEHLKPVPLLILDDATGPLGKLLPACCYMLEQWSTRTGTQVIVITHDTHVHANHICEVGN